MTVATAAERAERDDDRDAAGVSHAQIVDRLNALQATAAAVLRIGLGLVTLLGGSAGWVYYRTVVAERDIAHLTDESDRSRAAATDHDRRLVQIESTRVGQSDLTRRESAMTARMEDLRDAVGQLREDVIGLRAALMPGSGVPTVRPLPRNGRGGNGGNGSDDR